ncbi:MAG: hypothetical protein H7263_13355 [Candidatus Sericytochromatia bacterium]|nr:hypothetical protein [Candidatus Sericytochromatia bacterium]
MNIQLAVKNIVINGTFSPQKFDKYFFLKNEIFNEGEIEDSSIFLTDFCIINTKKIHIQITQQQLIITEVTSDTLVSVMDIAEKIIKQTEFLATASGINFHYYKFTSDDIHQLSKKYFFNVNSEVNKYFSNDDVSYGYYLSKDFKGTRLKLDMKPATIQRADSGVNERIIQFQFNFHSDFTEQSNTKQLLEVIKNYQIYFNETQQIISLYE